MPVAATRQVRQPTRGTRPAGQTDRPYPLTGGLSPRRPARPPDPAAQRLDRLFDREPLRIRQAVYPVDKPVDLLLEYVYLAGGQG